MKVRNRLLWLFAIIILAAVNMLVVQKERLITGGQVVLLELAPVDPRSLIQGDYMRLRYAITGEVRNTAAGLKDGFIVVKIDRDNVARYVRVHDPQKPLAPDELLLRFRQRGTGVRIGPDSFFFQEGHASYYNSARYGEFRVSDAGDVLLVGLRGDDLEPLGPP